MVATNKPRRKRTHPVFWGVLLASYAIFLIVPVVLAKLPVPDLVIGWCPKGPETGDYTVEKVGRALVDAVVLAAAALVISAATLTARVAWIRALWIVFAVGSGLGAYVLAAFIYGVEIDCGLCC